MQDQKLYIEPGDCNQCYRCIRVCPVKAIRMLDNEAVIDDDLCVGCSLCEKGCPQGLIKRGLVVGDVERAIDTGARVVASLHWSWFLRFRGVSSGALSAAFRALGFDSVSESLWGLRLYNETFRARQVSSVAYADASCRGGMVIGAQCAVARSMVRRYWGELDDCVCDIADPMTLHARLIRAWYGDQGVRVVYVAPCVGYADYAQDGDLVISFDQLQGWLSERGVSLSQAQGCGSSCGSSAGSSVGSSVGSSDVSSDGLSASSCAEFHEESSDGYCAAPSEGFYPGPCPWQEPLPWGGNVIRSHDLQEARELLQGAKRGDDVMLDLMACRGCVASCSAEAGWCSVADYMLSREHFAAKESLSDRSMPVIDTSAVKSAKFCVTAGAIEEVAEDRVLEALESLSKFEPYDHHNCNACGYGTCVDFARAMARGMVTRQMCLSYSRSQMYRKYTALMERMPSGVMLVDGALRVIHSNSNMVRIMGGDARLVYDASRGLKGADVAKLVSFSSMIERVLESGSDVLDVEVEHDEKLLRVSVFSIEPGKSVCVVASNLLLGDVLDNQIITQTQQAIEENQRAVQQIAQLLGQSAARTQRVLHTITLKRK